MGWRCYMRRLGTLSSMALSEIQSTEKTPNVQEQCLLEYWVSSTSSRSLACGEKQHADRICANCSSQATFVCKIA